MEGCIDGRMGGRTDGLLNMGVHVGWWARGLVVCVEWCVNGGVGGCGNVCFVDRFINRFRISSGGVHVVVVRVRVNVRVRNIDMFRISSGGVHVVVVRVRVDVRVRNRVRVGVSSGGKVRVTGSFVVRFWMRIGVWICVRVRIQIKFFFFNGKNSMHSFSKVMSMGEGERKIAR